MNKAKINYFNNLLAFVSFIVVSVSGLALKFFMPSGIRQGRLQEFWGIQKESWLEIHEISGIFLIVFVAIHFFLHWNWIVYSTKNVFRKEMK